jgi:hypothetical protein
MIPVVSRSMGYTFKKAVEIDGIAREITEATVSIVRDGVELLEIDATVSDGVASAVLTPAAIAEWEKGRYSAKWSVVAEVNSASVGYQFVDFFTLAEVALSEVEITSDEVLRHAPYLSAVLDVLPGVVGSGSTSTKLTHGLTQTRGFPVVGADAKIKSGNLDGESSVVVAVGSGFFTVSPAFSGVPAEGDRFHLVRGISDQIRAGLDMVRSDLYSMGITEDMIVDLQQIRGLVLDATVSLLCFSNIREREDVWTFRHQKIVEAYSDRLSRLKAWLDTTGDLEPDTQTGFAQVQARR